MTDQMAAIHSELLFTHSSSSMNGHCQAHMSYMFIHKGGGGERSLVGWVTQGTISFVWCSAYGAKCQQAYLHAVCLGVPLSFAHSN